MGIIASYTIGILMLIALPPMIAVGDLVSLFFAAFGGLVALGYEELRARRAATRRPVLTPAALKSSAAGRVSALRPGMIPDAIEGRSSTSGFDPSGPTAEERVPS
ncbi:MAG: hypothetical protein R2882_04960 [Gemmatimonadales bacterium]